jgi:hypothetical protein
MKTGGFVAAAAVLNLGKKKVQSAPKRI